MWYNEFIKGGILMRQGKTRYSGFMMIPKPGANGCFRCCINYVQMAKEERERMGGYGERSLPAPDLRRQMRVYDAGRLSADLRLIELLLCPDASAARAFAEEETRSMSRISKRGG